MRTRGHPPSTPHGAARRRNEHAYEEAVTTYPRHLPDVAGGGNLRTQDLAHYRVEVRVGQLARELRVTPHEVVPQ